MPAIVWFTLDLRLKDHPALAAAARDYTEVIPVYILDDSDPWSVKGAARWWLHHSLKSLEKQIADLGGKLILKRGEYQAVLKSLCQSHKVDAIYFSRAYEPWLDQQQRKVSKLAESFDIQVKRYTGRLMLEPETVKNLQGKPFQVFTPFYKSAKQQLGSPSPKRRAHIQWSQTQIASDKLSTWSLLPTKPNWANEFEESWQPGEKGAEEKLKTFKNDAAKQYSENRDIPSEPGTSQLSPHLHFGEISPIQVLDTIRNAPSLSPDQSEPYIRQLFWREFSFHLIHHWPHFPEKPFREQFAQFPWRESKDDLRAWQRGLTGYPIIDAGMRELWSTGWMHNRVRMITASFLTKHLLIPWQKGEAWFWDTLVDADLANNSAGWQWVAGSGADAAPYFRVFNPILQGEKFDPKGEYVRRWVPELANLSDKFIHKPWEASNDELSAAQVELGKNYPTPIVDHSEGRKRALAAYEKVKNSPH